MRVSLLPALIAGLGAFLAATAALAVAEHATTAATVFGLAGGLHLAIAAGLIRGSRTAAVVGAIVGLVDLALVATGLAFIVGIEAGVGLDLGTNWFAPLNGYATIIVAIAIAAAAAAMVATGLRAVRSRTPEAAPAV